MSIPNKATVNCPNCNAAFTTTVWSSVNTDLSDDLAEKIISGEFFDAKCPECGFTAHMEYDVLYHDVKRNVMIWVVHTNTPDYEKKCAEIKSTSMLPGYKTRMVRDMNELREKVAALEAGRDDRVIEICKYFLKYEASQQHPEFETRNLFYTYADGKEIVFLYDINGKDMSCYLDPKLYDMMEERFSERLLDFKDNDYAIYDAQWAANLFQQHLDEDFDDEIDEDYNDNKEGQLSLFDALEVDTSSSEDNKEPQTISNKKTSCFEGNPFLVLNVSCLDDRRKILSAAEEMSFFADADECTEAQNTLITPGKRLSAELDWFIETDISVIKGIKTCLNNDNPIFIDNLNALSKLNAMIYNFCTSDETDSFSLGLEILDIDKQFGELAPTTLTGIINNCRRIAKMAEVTESDISIELYKKRERIRSIISGKLQLLEESDYIELVTLFAEKYIADDEYNDSGVISDVIDQYEVKMQSTIEEANEKILSHIEKIKTLVNDEGIEANLNGLISRVKKWDVLVQPLQLNSQASGVVHKDSRNIGGEIRELSLWLHNEKGLSELALKLVEAMIPVFAELTDLAEIFESDSDALTNIIRDNKEAEQAVAEMNSIKAFTEGLKSHATSVQIDEFINKVKAANKRMKNLSLDEDLITQIRENICYLAREVAIALHNEKQQTEYALRIAIVLVAEFGDLSDANSKLRQDVATLREQGVIKNRIKMQQEAREREEKTKKIGSLVVIGIVLLIWIISSLSQCDSSTSSTSSSYSSSSSSSSSSSYGSSSSSVEELFSQSVSSGTKVYANIVSIFPEMGIYTQGSSYYTSFVCKCKTSAGTTVWVHISVSEYRSNFDSSASSSTYNEYAEEVTFSSSKKIRGTAKTSNSVLSGLSSDIGASMLIEFTSVD